MNTDLGADPPVLQVSNLAITYETRDQLVRAVRDVSFQIHRGETFGIVGESGCGKSTVAFGIVSFLGRNGRIVNGSILFDGQELRGQPPEELRRLRGNRISMVYQDPMQALNPSLRIGHQLSEALVFHQELDKAEARAKCVEMLERVYMPDPEAMMMRYPHQLSGGQQQRIVIAMALLNNPLLLIMDEPTTALDVTVEAAVLDLIAELGREFDTAIMYITHNLGVVARVSDRAGVMYAGEMVEQASVDDIFMDPLHPYTQGLMRCVPKLGRSKASSRLYPIRGRVPSLTKLPGGCVFQARCDYARHKCLDHYPQLREAIPAHLVRCWFAEEIDRDEWQPPSDLTPATAPVEMPEVQSAAPILDMRDLKTYYEQSSASVASLFGLGKTQYIKAVDGISLQIPKGYTLGVVGESGCGKSTLAKTIVGLEALTEGELDFLGFDVSVPVSERDLDLIREIQMVFQNPDSTMNPAYSIGFQISRPLRRFKSVPPDKVRGEVIRLLESVRLDRSYYNRLPRQLSGGEKQRVGIARAFASRPELVLCDEPVSALDVSVQAAVLNLLTEIQRQHGTTMMFIAHDLSVVRFFSDYVAVMYLGHIVEFGPAEAIYAPPYHPYTEALLSAVPIPDPTVEQMHIRLEGTVPSALHPPSGCRFHTRCPRRDLLPDGGAICAQELPPWRHGVDEHRILCHIPVEELSKMKPVVTTEVSNTSG